MYYFHLFIYVFLLFFFLSTSQLSLCSGKIKSKKKIEYNKKGKFRNIQLILPRIQLFTSNSVVVPLLTRVYLTSITLLLNYFYTHYNQPALWCKLFWHNYLFFTSPKCIHIYIIQSVSPFKIAKWDLEQSCLLLLVFLYWMWRENVQLVGLLSICNLTIYMNLIEFELKTQHRTDLNTLRPLIKWPLRGSYTILSLKFMYNKIVILQ